MIKTIGFTATQYGLTRHQKNELESWLSHLSDYAEIAGIQLHHGGCVEGDEFLHNLVRTHPVLSSRFILHVWPANDVDPKKVAALAMPYVEYDARPALERNHMIVDATEVLIACPRKRAEQQRSGTWATWRYARKIGRTTITIWP